MKVRTIVVPLMFFVLVGLCAHTEATPQATAATHSGAPALNSNPPSKSSSPQTTRDQEALDKKCVEAGRRLERSAAAMVGGRTWRWRLDSEWSRQHLDELRRNLKTFWDAEAAFEASLRPEQRSKLNSQFTAIHDLFQHLERDAQSLDDELRKGYPTRWHVENDVSDMRKEINRWRKLQRRIADDLGIHT